MERIYYREQALETIARRVVCAFDACLYYGPPMAIPIEEIIERNGLSLEYQCLRKNGSILGKTIFDDGLETVYDQERHEYILFPVTAGTILIDASLCENEESAGRLRFTCAHELAHWVLHKKLHQGTGESAAMNLATQEDDMEIQANILGSAILMPMAQVKRAFYRMRAGRGRDALVTDMASLFQVSRQAMRIRLANHHLI